MAKKLKFKKSFTKLTFFLIELVIIFWILGCLYVWLVLEFMTNPGLIIVRPSLSPKIIDTLEKSSQFVWPYIWKDYIYNQK